MSSKKIITRFPPSPTGKLHIGNARTALFNYLFAKQNGGKIILRFEDTDRLRSKKEYEDNIADALAWLGLRFDETYRQSERTNIYKKYITELLEKNAAYISEEVTDNGVQSNVIRFRNPRKTITFSDLIRGDITFDTSELGDFIIARSADHPVYHLAVVIDDWQMGMTHIIRGEDHISNTPRQILIQEALGVPRPLYAHLPLILSKDRAKLSKRGGSVATTDYRDQGFLPEALVNYLALLGWNPGTDQEIFSLDELVQQFDIMKIQKGGAVFDFDKLLWINKTHIKKLPPEKFTSLIRTRVPHHLKTLPEWSEERLKKISPLLQEKVSTLCDVRQQFEVGEYDYFFGKPIYEATALLPKDEKNPQKTGEKLTQTIALLETISADFFSEVSVKEKIWDFATQVGRGFVLWPMRFALSGREKSPDPFTIAAILGKGETLERLKEAVWRLRSLS